MARGPFLEIQRKALSLPSQDRAELARALLASLDEDDSDDLDPTTWKEIWIEEAERRMREIDEGRTSLLDSDEVMAEARARLRSP